jgi:gamma-glutamyltranspeptidase/glutathione hydrolase
MATPGADGQVQTLLQVLGRLCTKGERLADAVDAPRWRSEGGAVLIEQGHPAMAQLERRGHHLQPVPSGDMRFGAVVCAGVASSGPFALSDWRRECWSGVA